jgi:bzd-type benzoyl-CoA reductase N subunit
MLKTIESQPDRAQIGKQLKDQGKKVVGYYCCYPPLELFTAASLVPFRILGNMSETITLADAYLETIMCPFVRSSFDLALKGNYEFFDGFVCPHTCDTVERMYNIWNYYLKPGYSHFINIPHRIDDASYDFFKAELSLFKSSLEKFTGDEITDDKLQGAIDLHNQNRSLMRQIYDLRKEDPPKISGEETLKAVILGLSMPVKESNELFKKIIDEARNRSDGPPKRDARMLVYGSEVDDPLLVNIVEDSGANVVADDMCLGSRIYGKDVNSSSNPIDAIANHYLYDIMCPRTYRRLAEEPYEEELDLRFRHIKDSINEFNVNSVILYITRFCDTHELDVPDIRDYLEADGIPVLHIEYDYSAGAMGQVKTRVGAFLEMIGAEK